MKTFTLLLLIALVAGCISQAAERPALVQKLNVTPAEEQMLSGNKTPSSDGAQQANGTAAAPAVKEFDITAKSSVYNPDTITVNKGDTVRIRLTSIDVTHGFVLGAYGINAQINPGETTLVEFNATEQGTFPFMCNVYCGTGHSGMKGLLIVQ